MLVTEVHVFADPDVCKEAEDAKTSQVNGTCVLVTLLCAC